jgi:hypothetical protein
VLAKKAAFWHVDKTWEWQILAWPSWDDARQLPDTFAECHLIRYCWITRDPLFQAGLGCSRPVDFHMSDITFSKWVQILVL